MNLADPATLGSSMKEKVLQRRQHDLQHSLKIGFLRFSQ
jgi:hypothetical protein